MITAQIYNFPYNGSYDKQNKRRLSFCALRLSLLMRKGCYVKKKV
nr:MAG TPA: Protein of unknown function (DUF2735) [Microviridae sp.]